MKPKITLTPPEGPVETRVHDLEEEVAMLRRHVTDAAAMFDHVEKKVGWLRKRLAALLPERHHCPHCKAIVHQAAVACGACGKSWGKVEDPKRGLPL